MSECMTQKRAPQNSSLPTGVRRTADGRYQVRGMREVPGKFVETRSGGRKPLLERVELGKCRNLADAVALRQAFEASNGRLR